MASPEEVMDYLDAIVISHLKETDDIEDIIGHEVVGGTVQATIIYYIDDDGNQERKDVRFPLTQDQLRHLEEM